MKTVKKIVIAGLIVGTLDISAACIQYWLTTGKDPFNGVLPFVASGVFGREAFNGSVMMKVWGLIFHYMIAFGATAFFFLLHARFDWMRRNKIITGILYGLFLWAVTTQIIVRFSRIGARPIVLSKAAMAAAILIVCIGIPLAYLAPEKERSRH